MTLIKDAGLKFPRARIPLAKVEKIVIHHPVANWTIYRIHEYFLGLGWNGSAYNYYVQKNGEAYYGRSSDNQEFMGDHARPHNHNTIGVCAEGNFEIEHMQPLQYNKLVDVVVHLCKKHKLTEKDVVGHKELQYVSTSCPGRNFHMDKFRMDVRARLNKKEEDDDQLKLTGYQWGELEKNVGELLKDKVITSQEWLKKVKNNSLTVSELSWLNNMVLMRLKK